MFGFQNEMGKVLVPKKRTKKFSGFKIQIQIQLEPMIQLKTEITVTLEGLGVFFSGQSFGKIL